MIGLSLGATVSPPQKKREREKKVAQAYRSECFLKFMQVMWMIPQVWNGICSLVPGGPHNPAQIMA